MLVELAVGDAYGGGFEYASPEFVAAHNDLSSYVQHPRHTDLEYGSYTDDTQMTIAIAEVLVSGKPWTRDVLADAFVATYHRDRRAGYASGFQRLLTEVTDGADLLDRIRPHSDKSGAAMRAGPIGLLPTVSAVLEHACVQARITHDTPGGVESARAAALAVHYCHFDLGPVGEIGHWIDDQLHTTAWAEPWHGKVGAQGAMSTRAALTAIAAGGGLAEILHRSVAFTGDVDTVATIALGAASRSPRITQDLPAQLVHGLEDGTYGRRYLEDLDTRLFAAIPQP
ncbi:ADP-ribosylglycohydrolase [Herbihabitans rhizosphaerae]|uniref:ADP-ribosylglycohydrolase n=1 Tax=Herbihabitans rhizosphaerae TaxID=1872711 RepID=A0A4Q7L4T8_9PSEU|nr:ADP-ribosylglycohydrolase family protein [Herbihabitans rhizosphaerae]RZS43242.1 ADP-ribosylglycohydrolase [Herbihabitans rhizosphaerae]